MLLDFDSCRPDQGVTDQGVTDQGVPGDLIITDMVNCSGILFILIEITFLLHGYFYRTLTRIIRVD